VTIKILAFSNYFAEDVGISLFTLLVVIVNCRHVLLYRHVLLRSEGQHFSPISFGLQRPRQISHLSKERLNKIIYKQIAHETLLIVHQLSSLLSAL
jgi:hypothetical protein